MSSSRTFSGMNMVILIVILGLVGLLVEPIVFLVYVAVLGYYLYTLEKRLASIEARSGNKQDKP